MCIRQRIGGSNPPLTAIFEMRACTQVRALFFYILRRGGMRTPDQGSTTGAASWTDRARSKRAAPQGRAKRVNPPSPPYFKKSSYASSGFFFACGIADIPGVGSNASPGLPDPTRQVVRPRAVPPGSESIPPHRHILRRARTHVRAFFSHVAPQTSPGSAAMPLPGYQTVPAR